MKVWTHILAFSTDLSHFRREFCWNFKTPKLHQNSKRVNSWFWRFFDQFQIFEVTSEHENLDRILRFCTDLSHFRRNWEAIWRWKLSPKSKGVNPVKTPYIILLSLTYTVGWRGSGRHQGNSFGVKFNPRAAPEESSWLLSTSSVSLYLYTCIKLLSLLVKVVFIHSFKYFRSRLAIPVTGSCN